MTQFSDNSVAIQLPERNPTFTITTIYPPPTANDIVEIKYCMNLDKIFLLLATGMICIYGIDKKMNNSAVLEKTIKSN